MHVKAALLLKDQNHPSEESSICCSELFTVYYCDDIRADNVVDGNIMDSAPLHRLSANEFELDFHALAQPRIFHMASACSDGNQAKLVFSKEVLINIELHTRH